MSTTTPEKPTDGYGVACHCDGDQLGHAPGARSCEPVRHPAPVANRHPNSVVADTYGVLAKLTRDPDLARRLRRSAAITREARKARYWR